MITNRMMEQFEEPRERQPPEDFYVVVYRFTAFFVVGEVAAYVIEALRAEPLPRWIRFTDLNGAEVTLRSECIEYVQECTADQRAAARRFFRARDEEEKADARPWEDD